MNPTHRREARLAVWAALALAVTVRLAAQEAAPAGSASGPPDRWWKGNTHTHTLNSDGDSPPGEVAHWYRDNGYDFLVLSDHNFFTVVDELQRELDRETERTRDEKAPSMRKRKLLLIPGEEVTSRFEQAPAKAEIHVNALGSLRVVGAQKGSSKLDVIQRSVDGIHAAGGVPSVNHPNYAWSITADDLAAVKGLRHFEIFNGHPGVHNWGGGAWPSLEDLWDDLLTRGVRLWGVAVDDAHDFKHWGPRYSNPGRGWIVVRAPELTRAAIRKAFEAGDFYASTGVSLAEVRREGDAAQVRIQPDDDTRFTAFWIGERGRVLARSKDLESTYTLQPSDRYARVHVFSSRGEHAWTQPFYR
ncbi:MAG: CehA/McbA family metallohydrolase [Planctomycetes bacterium]|nr:CehA/McbA family metallohydrolase [Planctomycetota bacterium]